MKGLSTTILIVITAVVILVAALVILTIFGTGMQTVGTVAQAQSMCVNEAAISCPIGWPPATWNIQTKRMPNGNTYSCSQLVTCPCENGKLTKECTYNQVS